MPQVIKTPNVTVVFGDRANTIDPNSVRNTTTALSLENIQAPYVIFQHQVHDIHGLAITHENINTYRSLLTHDSDYLITNMPSIGIGVLTADCLPIALFDPINRAIGIIHAGWRGSVFGIVKQAIIHMKQMYNTQPEQVLAWLGPCAHPCCYQVNQAFIEKLPVWALQAVTSENYFDLLTCNTLALCTCGVQERNIDRSHSLCTICNHEFLSYRRNPSLTTRQPSIIWLNE